jgi:hypothetical protein
MRYNVFTTDGDTPLATRARKDAAIKFATDHGLDAYRVVTDSGTVVHEVFAPVAEPVTETEDLIGSVADADAEPDLADEVVDDEPAEPGFKFDIAKMKSKISKLLAKAEGTDNQDERDAFTAKAEKLMIQLGIDAAELEAAGEVKAEDIIEVRFDFKGGYALTFVGFVHAVAMGFGGLTVLQAGRGGHRSAYVIGHKSDVELFSQLIKSLELQAMSALHAWQKADPARKTQDNNTRFIGSRSFLDGYGRTVGIRLGDLRRSAVEVDASPGAALVLASKDDRVRNWVDETYGQLKAGRAGNRRYSSIAAAAGGAAGAKANLGGAAQELA